MHQAAQRNDTAAVVTCLAAGEQPSGGAGTIGASELHWAALYQNAAMTDALIRAGAVVNARNCIGHTPLHWAAERDGACCVALLEAGADVNAAGRAGWTPLHVAALAGAARAVEHLLAFGADAGARTRSGETPLHLATQRHHLHIAATLAAAARWAGMRRVALTAWAAGGSTTPPVESTT